MFVVENLGRLLAMASVFAMLAVTTNGWAASVKGGAESDYTRSEDSAPRTFDFDNNFNWTGVATFTASSSNTSLLTVSINVLSEQFTVSPVANANGTATITITATDLVSTASHSFNVTLTPVNDAPFVAAVPPNVTVAEDSAAWTLDLSTVFGDVDIGNPSDTLTFLSTRSNPALFGAGTGIVGSVLTLVPAPDAFGTSTVNLTATDSAGASVGTSFTFTVTAVNDPPTATGVKPVMNYPEDSGPRSVNIAGMFTDVDGPPLTYSVTAVGTPGLFSAGPTISGSNLTFTPALNQNGNSSVTIQASDGSLSATDTVTITITPVNDPPTVAAAPGPVTVLEDSGPGSASFAGVFTDVDGDTLTLSYVSHTNPTLFTAAPSMSGDTLNFTPALNANGASVVTVRAQDPGGLSVTTTITINVTPVNDPPVASGAVPVIVVNEDSGASSTSVAAVFTDADGDPLTLSVTGFTNPALFSSAPTISGGNLTFTPALNQNGSSSVTVEARDPSNATASVSVSVTITPVNDPPTVVAPPAPVTVLEDSGAGSASFAGVFTDIDGDPLTLSYVSHTNGPLFSPVPSMSGTSLNFTPALNANGSSVVTVRAQDPGGLSVTTTITINVTAVNDPPTVANPLPDLTRPEDAPPLVINVASVFADVDIGNPSDTLTYAAVSSNPGLVTVSMSGSSLTLTQVADMNGVATITVTATDSAGASVSDPFVLTVDPVDDLPAAADDSATMAEDSGPISIPVLANDYLAEQPTTIVSAGTTLTIAGVSYPGSSESTPISMPDGAGGNVTLPTGSVVINGNNIEYTPRANFAGVDFFSYTIQDSDGQQSTARVTITITPVNDPPQPIGSVSYTIVQATFLNILAAGGLVNQAFDADGDTVTVIQDTSPSSILLGFTGTTLSLSPDGSFNYAPDVNFVGTDTFQIRYFDGVVTSGPVVVSVVVTPTPPPPAPAPAGEVEFDFKLANVPLEDAISAEANVLVIMDDSGSMDWAIMAPEVQGEFWLNNGPTKDNSVSSRTRSYRYVIPAATNVYGNSQVVPTQQAIDADPDFAGNDYGVWRARNSQYNTIYYDPKVEYKPWVGLDRNNVEFANVNPLSAPLDPYDVPLVRINLTTPISYISNAVPKTRNGGSTKNLNNANVYIPSYYTTTATGTPAHNAPRTLVQINNPVAIYTGGPARSDCAVLDGDPLTCTYVEELQNFANWFTYYRSREYSAKAALGRAVADVTNLRMGYVVLNDSNERIRIQPMNASYRVGNKRALMHQIYKIDSNNGTPLRAALDKAGKHFECRTGDSFGSTANTAPGNAACPVLPSPEGQCQNNFAMLFSDGTWNGNFSLRGNEDADGPGPFDGGKFADTISQTLADVAMYYYERDLHPSLLNGVPTTARDIAGAPVSAFSSNGETMHQHMKTYTVGFGLTGLIDPASVPTSFGTPFAWTNPFNDGLEKVDDMLHAAVNGRGAFLQANNPVLLSQAFQTAFAEFSDGSVSVSAVAFNSTALREQTVEYRGFFNLRFNTGDLRALAVNTTTGIVDNANPIWRAAVRLDSQSPTSRVIVTYDRVADQGIPFRHASLNANQQAMMSLNEVNFLRGDRSQEEPLGALRQRPAVEGVLGDIVHSAPQFVGGPRAIRRDQAPYPTQPGKLYSAFKAANASREAIVYVGANDGMMHGFSANTGNERFAYVPNKLMDTSQRFKNNLDQLTSLTYAHRFFVDVTPTVEDVFMPPTKSAVGKDWATIMVGALGGGGKGYYALNISDPGSRFSAENNAAGAVLWEFTDADDTYPVDSSGAPLGGGGLLDLAGQPIRDLGYAYSPAQIVMSNVSDGATTPQKKWTAIFGNGYNSTAGIATLFILNIEDGLNGWQPGDFKKLTTGEGVKAIPDPLAGLPNGLGVPAVVDKDLNGTADLVYAGDLFGNLYRFDITDSNRTNWKVTKIFQATYDNGGTIERQPITTQPFVTKHPSGTGFLIVFGTGSYVTEGDGTSLEVQSVYGIWDRLDIAPPTALPNAKTTRLVRQTITNIYDPVVSAFERLRFSSNNPVNYAPDAGIAPGVYGWYFDLNMQRPATTNQSPPQPNPDTTGNAPPLPQFPGERAIRRFVPRGGALLVTTVIPRDENTCFRSPPGSTFPIDFLTGGTPKRPIIDLNNDGIINDLDMVTIGGEQYAAGILFDTDDLDGTLVDPSILLGTGGADFLFLSGGDDQITLRVAGAEDPKTGRLSWRELDDAN